MDGAIKWDVPAEPLIKSVFPDEKLPIGVGQLFSFYKSRLQIDSYHYHIKEKRWIFAPFMTSTAYAVGMKEAAFALFMSQLNNAVQKFPFLPSRFQPQRQFTGAFCVKPVIHMQSTLQ